MKREWNFLQIGIDAAALIGGGAYLARTPIIELALRGRTLYRVYGGASGPHGRSWSLFNPLKYRNYRDRMGLPNKNLGDRLTRGILRNSKGVKIKRADPLDGNRGGGLEIVVPNPQVQIPVRVPPL